jgi:glycosyltransferase involved in cell wall biosynthesis
MKLVIQIPCFDEEAALGQTLRSLPKSLPGIDLVEVMIVDDGSTDATVKVAEEMRVDHIVRLPRHRGLAQAFVAGLEAAIARGADLIVNTDADNQYRADDIARLIEPILAGRAQLVVGDRGVATLAAFSPLKRWLQRLGSFVVQRASGLATPDATSGFRALSREAALRTVVLSHYSYTLETLIQAGSQQLAIEYVPVRTNPSVRRSRLMRSMSQYLVNSTVTILRTYAMYRPLRIFVALGAALLAAGMALGLRFLWFYFHGDGSGHVQSVILAAVLLIVGFQVCLIGLLADLIRFNRKILEEILYRTRRSELERAGRPRAPDPPGRAPGA